MAAHISKVPSLKRFILRQQTLKLYRDILRAVREVPDEAQRKELQMWARHDFEANRNLKDEDFIKMQIARGRLALKELLSTLHLSK
ncbi:LYR motif-containing protein 2-like [Ornithodoros turicata]|uniref:LYR motif-containing protein 2-like n=1 Tax=Ornithodoros turicata TaxID=34597 RepID=UPI003138933A